MVPMVPIRRHLMLRPDFGSAVTHTTCWRPERSGQFRARRAIVQKRPLKADNDTHC